MAKAIINIKTDKEVKENARNLAKDLGLSLSDVINASLRNFIRSREVYFSSIPKMTPEFERFLGNVEKDIEQGRNLSIPLHSAEEAKGYLESL